MLTLPATFGNSTRETFIIKIFQCGRHLFRLQSIDTAAPVPLRCTTSSLCSVFLIHYVEHHSDNFLKRADDFDPCHKFASVSDSCSAEGFNPDAETETCNAGYVYDRSQMTETLSTTLNLVCDEEHKRRLLGSTLMMGEDTSVHSTVKDDEPSGY